MLLYNLFIVIIASTTVNKRSIAAYLLNTIKKITRFWLDIIYVVMLD